MKKLDIKELKPSIEDSSENSMIAGIGFLSARSVDSSQIQSIQYSGIPEESLLVDISHCVQESKILRSELESSYSHASLSDSSPGPESKLPISKRLVYFISSLPNLMDNIQVLTKSHFTMRHALRRLTEERDALSKRIVILEEHKKSLDESLSAYRQELDLSRSEKVIVIKEMTQEQKASQLQTKESSTFEKVLEDSLSHSSLETESQPIASPYVHHTNISELVRKLWEVRAEINETKHDLSLSKAEVRQLKSENEKYSVSTSQKLDALSKQLTVSRNAHIETQQACARSQNSERKLIKALDIEKEARVAAEEEVQRISRRLAEYVTETEETIERLRRHLSMNKCIFCGGSAASSMVSGGSRMDGMDGRSSAIGVGNAMSLSSMTGQGMNQHFSQKYPVLAQVSSLKEAVHRITRKGQDSELGNAGYGGQSTKTLARKPSTNAHLGLAAYTMHSSSSHLQGTRGSSFATEGQQYHGRGGGQSREGQQQSSHLSRQSRRGASPLRSVKGSVNPTEKTGSSTVKGEYQGLMSSDLSKSSGSSPLSASMLRSKQNSLSELEGKRKKDLEHVGDREMRRSASIFGSPARSSTSTHVPLARGVHESSVTSQFSDSYIPPTFEKNVQDNIYGVAGRRGGSVDDKFLQDSPKSSSSRSMKPSSPWLPSNLF
ncbi:hypothetical protein ADUPG1_010713 [Aduncisulcus paluster]|uniref:Uncharacterized protein n=1 Tax=Aduncisulcus paluster TaxID=2918883 RepID=A0ABQ5JSI1_9EUKA|nr:hypothetical protein ADUPG1_010713 [Aduncisulcus paluster]